MLRVRRGIQSLALLCVVVVALSACGSRIGVPVSSESRASEPPPGGISESETPAAYAAVDGGPLPDGFEPARIAFWDGRRGLVAGTLCSAECQGGVVARTEDGGRTWSVVLKTSTSVDSLTVAGSDSAWVEAGRLLRSTDGGRTWVPLDAAVARLSFANDLDGWGVPTDAANEGTSLSIAQTHDGGKTWSSKTVPCEDTIRGVSAVGPAAVYALCAGLHATIDESKQVLFSRDGGDSWTTRVVVDLQGVRPKDAGLTLEGYAQGIDFLDDGKGWLWESRGGFYMTEDGGRHWKAVPLHVEPDVIEVWDASRVSDSVGFVLRREELLRTADGGRTWVSVVDWSR